MRTPDRRRPRRRARLRLRPLRDRRGAPRRDAAHPARRLGRGHRAERLGEVDPARRAVRPRPEPTSGPCACSASPSPRTWPRRARAAGHDGPPRGPDDGRRDRPLGTYAELGLLRRRRPRCANAGARPPSSASGVATCSPPAPRAVRRSAPARADRAGARAGRRAAAARRAGRRPRRHEPAHHPRGHRAERDRGHTVITTTHDIGSASRADLVVLVATDVVAFGPPEEVLTPEHLSRAFGGHLHVLPDGTLVLDDPAHHVTPHRPRRSRRSTTRTTTHA
jgi:hypothetical protein